MNRIFLSVGFLTPLVFVFHCSVSWAADPRAKYAVSTPVPTGMVLIPAGPFTMGDAIGDGYRDERPTRSFQVGAFFMDKYEVTKVLWDEVYTWAKANGYSFDNVGSGKAFNHPVHTVNWYDCVKWCNARSQKSGKKPCYYTNALLTQVYKTSQMAPYVDWAANGYRLPKEAEWEKAARGGLSGKRFPWGDTISHSQANYRGSSDYSYDISQSRDHHPNYHNDPYPYTSLDFHGKPFA